MSVRFRYFPAFAAVAFLGLLCIPVYYVDLWSSTMPSRVVPESSSSIQEDDVTPSPPPPHSKDEIGFRRRQASMDDRLIEVTAYNISSHDLVSRYQEPRRLRQSLPLEPYVRRTNLNPVTLDAYGVDVVGFALRMARDRLRMEKYGHYRRRPPSSSSPPVANEIFDEADLESKAAAAVANENPVNVTEVLIVTYFRGGTTFFGDLLNEYPGTFYHFEPLHSVTQNDQVQSSDEILKSMNILRNLFRCDYENLSEYVDYVREPDHRFLFEHNRRLWFACQFHSALCYNRNFLTSICSMHPIRVTKLVRLRLAQAKQLLVEVPNLKVIYLVRDPRGLYSSRRDLAWCNLTRSCIEPTFFCEDMRRDIAVAAELKRTMPDRFLAIRYEDFVAIDTDNQLAKVLDFLGLEPHPRLNRFITSHSRLRTGENPGGPYSTKRDSRKAPFLWRRKLSVEEIAYVEDACSDVIRRLNFT